MVVVAKRCKTFFKKETATPARGEIENAVKSAGSSEKSNFKKLGIKGIGICKYMRTAESADMTATTAII
jgi:hypothetical protein